MKKAFLVGINSYADAPLNGCVNDVIAMETYLKSQGFATKTCINEQATHSNILRGMQELASGVNTGDTIVFHYSGHGSQVPDRNRDESDGKDEILCPVDIDFYRGKYITDDEINTLFSVKKGVNIEIIFDCCHSGTGLRSMTTNRFLPAPDDLTKEQVIRSRELVVPTARQGNVVLWAACRENETAADAYVNGSYNGAFTFSLIKSLKTTTIRRDLEKEISKTMQSCGWPQHAQLECSVEQQSATFAGLAAKQTLLRKLQFWK